MEQRDALDKLPADNPAADMALLRNIPALFHADQPPGPASDRNHDAIGGHHSLPFTPWSMPGNHDGSNRETD